MRVTWSHVAFPDDSHRALYSPGNETHGVRTDGAAGRKARTSDGMYGARTNVPPAREAGLTHMILMASVAGKQKIFLAGGDMSCPGAALIQTAGLQARLPDVASIEANARQFLPAANKAWEARFPGMFRITDGMIRTGELTQPGLGA